MRRSEGPAHVLSGETPAEEDITPATVAAPWGIGDIIGVFLLTIASYVLILAVAGVIVGPLHLRGHQTRELGANLAATAAFELCFFSLAVAFSVWKYHLSWRQFGFVGLTRGRVWLRDGVFAYVPLPVAGIVGSYAIVVVYAELVVLLHLRFLQPEPNLPTGIFHSTLLIAIAGVEACVMAPIVEETFFRGFLFRGFLGKRISFPGSGQPVQLGFWPSALLSGVLFAALHGHIGLLIPFTGVGMLFAWLYWRSGSLWTNILAHAGFNTFQFLLSLAVLR